MTVLLVDREKGRWKKTYRFSSQLMGPSVERVGWSLQQKMHQFKIKCLPLECSKQTLQREMRLITWKWKYKRSKKIYQRLYISSLCKLQFDSREIPKENETAQSVISLSSHQTRIPCQAYQENNDRPSWGNNNHIKIWNWENVQLRKKKQIKINKA